ncbi:MAG TPA: ankyrin repeat domain-containing protein [Oligoflexia bacterium]|nr:ankyrin repeat domain-containing protein [Oligoflexia bacterium]HMR24451.1 ankyrin repeat domain-containing protein [Oligoflexia bacterium]
MVKKIILTLLLFFGPLFAQVPDQNDFFDSEKFMACSIALPEKNDWCTWFASFQFSPDEPYSDEDFNNMLLMDKNKSSDFYPLELVLHSLKNGNIDLAKKLIEAGADLHEEGETYEFIPYPIFAAIELNNIEILDLMIKHGAKLNIKNPYSDSSPLIFASYNEENLKAALHLLNVINNSENPLSLLNMQDYEGKSALYYASQWNDKKFALDLIDSGANINLTNTKGNSLIMLAAKYSYDNEKLFNCIHFLLLQDNIDINHVNNNNENILFQLFFGPYYEDNLVIKEKTKNLIELLINDHEVNIEQTNKKGESILFSLVQKENSELLNLFLEHGMDINNVNNANENLLIIAIKRQSTYMIDFLFNHGIKNSHKKKAMQYAQGLIDTDSNYESITNYLKSKMK